MRPSIRSTRQDGFAMILVAVFVGGMMVVLMLNLEMTRAHAVTQEVERFAFRAKQIAESAAAQALARLKMGGVVMPGSGGGVTPQWMNFGDGQFYYYTTTDPVNGVSVIRAWGRVAAEPTTSSSTAAPDSTNWNGTGWMVQGIEVTVSGKKYIPDAPGYFGNGGIEKPMGGFLWDSSADPADPTTWSIVTSSPSSTQASWVPFQMSALDHPIDYIYNGGSPTPASANPHPHNFWASQNPIGQFNIEAWFANSAGAGFDPTIGLTPPPTSSYFDTSDPESADYPYPIEAKLPDVQSFAFDLWKTYKDDIATTKLSDGSHAGDFGDLGTPGVTFITGSLTVDAGDTFRGAGILVIRDDYDPNVDTNNTPSTKAGLTINGKFEWTGLVIVSGWAPTVEVTNTSGAEATIVGSLFGEDSVQSGSESSLDSATITLRVDNPLRLLYSSALFSPGGLVHDFLPAAKKEVVGIRDL